MLTCPNCGVGLELALRRAEEPTGPGVQPVPTSVGPRPTNAVEFILAGRPYSLSQEDIHSAAKAVFPATIVKYYVILPDSRGDERRFPIKQVVRYALQTRFGEKFVEENFTAHRARDILRRLGFDVKQER